MTAISPSIVDDYALEKQTTSKFNKDLGQDEFLELMMAQLKHQDPMEPMDNGEFLGQMAQFSTVTGIDDMKESIEALTQTYATSQTLQSTQLVGQEVLIESNKLSLRDTGDTEGVFELESASGNVQMSITNAAGEVIRSQGLGDFPAGRHAFTWDGNNQQRDRVGPGAYSISITSNHEDTITAATVMTSRIIESVEFGNGSDTRLNTHQGEGLSLADIRQIRQSSVNSTTE